jgi:hypothetical protein
MPAARVIRPISAAGLIRPHLLWFDRAPEVTLLDPASAYRRTIVATVRSGSDDHPLIQILLVALRHAPEQARSDRGQALRAG